MGLFGTDLELIIYDAEKMTLPWLFPLVTVLLPTSKPLLRVHEWKALLFP